MKKSSPSIWHLLSKRQIDCEDLVNFCGLLRISKLYSPFLFALLFPFSIWTFFYNFFFNSFTILFYSIAVTFGISSKFFIKWVLSNKVQIFPVGPKIRPIFHSFRNRMASTYCVSLFILFSINMNDPFVLVLTAGLKRMMGHFCILMDLTRHPWDKSSTLSIITTPLRKEATPEHPLATEGGKHRYPEQTETTVCR